MMKVERIKNPRIPMLKKRARLDTDKTMAVVVIVTGIIEGVTTEDVGEGGEVVIARASMSCSVPGILGGGTPGKRVGVARNSQAGEMPE
jgi:hypothetical protein